jgi:maltose alpha-D-glucosyltransferase/alpha-amylase
MLRSFQYAIETASGRGRPGAGFNPREAFLEGYRARALTGGARFLPANPGALVAWTRLFELQKALYEVEYEVNNRPEWVHIPLRGMAQILAAR